MELLGHDHSVIVDEMETCDSVDMNQCETLLEANRNKMGTS